MKAILASAAVAAMLAASSGAHAATYVYDISGYNPGGHGAVSGTMTLDVVGGQVADGSATLSGGWLPGATSFSLVTVDNYPGPSTGWRAGDGTDWFGSNTNFPIDSNGLTFNSAAWGSGYVFGIYSAATTGAPYDGALFGPGGSRSYWTYNDSLTLSAVPEPATWAMLGLGFAGLGLVGYRKARAPRAVAL